MTTEQTITITVEPADPYARPTLVMQQIFREIETSPVPRTAKILEATISAKPRTIRKAIEYLLAGEYIRESAGPIKTFHPVRPYRPTPPPRPLTITITGTATVTIEPRRA